MLYRVKADHYLEGQYVTEGDMLEWDGQPSTQMLPLDDEAVNAVKERFGETNPGHVKRILAEAAGDPSATFKMKVVKEPEAKKPAVEVKETKPAKKAPVMVAHTEDEGAPQAPVPPMPAAVQTGVPASPAAANPPAPPAPVQVAPAAPAAPKQ